MAANSGLAAAVHVPSTNPAGADIRPAQSVPGEAPTTHTEDLTTVLTTPRLRLRPLTEADTDWWVRLHADDQVNRFVGAYTREQAAARLHDIQRQWAERGHGLCAVELTRTGEAIGRCGLNWWEQFGETEIGWTFARRHWGNGYAAEAARTVLAWGFGPLGLTRITAMIHHGNEASTAVARRLGFAPLREDVVLGRPCTVHALDHDDFAAP